MSQAPMFARAIGPTVRLAMYGLACLVLMVVDSRYGALGAVRSGVAMLVHPVQAALARPFDFIGDAAGFFSRHAELVAGQRRMEAERERLAALLQDRHQLEAENVRLRALLDLPPVPGTVAVAARITRVLPDPFARRLVIDRGSADGIAPGRPVVDAAGLLGQVTEVYPDSSVVTLLTSSEQAAPVQNLRNGLRLIVSGTGADSLLEVRYLDQHADLRVDDLLVTSGLDGVYPPGLQVARVLSVEPPRQTPFARAVCQPVAEIGQHRHVLVLKAREPSP